MNHTVVSMQWGGIKNGELLTLIERECFNVFLTGDKNLPNQQRLEDRPFAVLIMSAINWPVIRPYVHKVSGIAIFRRCWKLDWSVTLKPRL
jgi:hypothetical protein